MAGRGGGDEEVTGGEEITGGERWGGDTAAAVVGAGVATGEAGVGGGGGE